jgi:hypothetical protein
MHQAKPVKAGFVRTENVIAAMIINRAKRHRKKKIVDCFAGIHLPHGSHQ